MTTITRARSGGTLFVLSLLVLLGACNEDNTGPRDPVGPAPGEYGVVVNSSERSLTVFSVEGGSEGAETRKIGLGPEGSPVDAAVRGSLAVVPLGTYPFAVVVDLKGGRVLHTVALPEGSGATGAAFMNDSIVVVGNPALNTVSPLNVRTGQLGEEIEVGFYPETIVFADGRIHVLNTGLDLSTWEITGPGTVSVIDSTLALVGTIDLSGENPNAAALGADGRLYVLNSGTWGMGNGSLSVVDLEGGAEVAHHEGFGDFPGAVAVRDNGRILVGLYGEGIVEWDPLAEAFIHSPENPWTPAGIPPVASLGFDSHGRLYLTNPGECIDPGKVVLVGADGAAGAEFSTGVCPMELAFTQFD